MRVIGGRLKGKKLNGISSISNSSLRPTSDRVKENIFNILSHKFHLNLDGIKVLDLFAGTGSLGFESLSRGARSVTFVENDQYACRLIKENAKTLGVESSIELKKEDCFNLGLNQEEPFRLIFIDPPYGKRLGERVVNNIIERNWLRKGSLIVWEESTELSNLDELRVLDIRKYGETVLSFVEVMV